MKVLKVGVQYFMNLGPYQEIEIPSDVNVIALIGQWEKNPERSNEAGKSTFIEVIFYNLFGEARSKKETDLININFSEDMLTVCTYVLDNGNQITIRRGRTINNKAILELDGYEGDDKDNVNKVIEKIVGMTYDDADMTCYFRQSEMHTFMDAGPTEQKRLITKWLDRPYWVILEKTAKDALDEIQRSITGKQGFIQYSQEQLKSRELLQSQLDGHSNTLFQYQEELKHVRSEWERVGKSLDSHKKVNELLERKSDLEKQIKSIQRSLEKLNEDFESEVVLVAKAQECQRQIEKLRASLENIDEVKSDVSKSREQISSFKSQRAVLKNGLELIRKQFSDVRKFGGLCPVTSKTCTIIDKDATLDEIRAKSEEVKTDIEGFDISITNEQNSLEILETKIDRLNDKAQELAKLEGKDKPSTVKKRVTKITDSIEEKTVEAKEATLKLRKIEKQLEEFDPADEDIEDRYAELTEQVSKCERKIKGMNGAISMVQGAIAELGKLEEKMAATNEEITALTEQANDYKFVAFMFGKSGIPSNQVEASFDELEEEINYILKKLQASFQVEFQAIKELKQWEDNCIVCGHPFPNGRARECVECNSERTKKKKDELSIKIIQGNKPLSFALMSGGAKVLATFAVRIALIRMQRRRSQARLRFAVMDEILGSLDSVNKENILQAITKVLVEELGIEQVYLISHTEVKNHISDVILVKRGRKFSTFGWMTGG